MKRIITIPRIIEAQLRKHLFQSEVEQGAFLYAMVEEKRDELTLKVVDFYMVPKEGWQVQKDVYLEMKDSERAKIMQRARKGGYAVIDCHSHPGSEGAVEFSPSDKNGIADFAVYAKWKLGAKPFAAIVFGEASLDAVVWHDDFKRALAVDAVQITGERTTTVKPQRGWFAGKPKPWWRRLA